MNSIKFLTAEFAHACDDWLRSQPKPGISRLEALCRLKQFKLVAMLQDVREEQPVNRSELEACASLAIVIGFDGYVAVDRGVL